MGLGAESVGIMKQGLCDLTICEAIQRRDEYIDQLQDKIRRRNLQIKGLKDQTKNLEVTISNGIDYLKSMHNTDSQCVISLLQNR